MAAGDKSYDVGEISALVPLRAGKPDLSGNPKLTRVVSVTCEDCGEVRLLSVEVLKIPV